jgi:hypothetical protein
MRRLFVLVTCSVLFLGIGGLAAAADLTIQPELDQADGWIQVSKGYWERVSDTGRLETVAMGRAGLEQVLANLRAELVYTIEEFLAHPSEEMHDVLRVKVALIMAIEEGLSRPAVEITNAKGWCDYAWDASAGPKKLCKNYASANASYYGSSAGDCMGLCDIYAYAYTRRTLCNSSTVTDSETCSQDDVINQGCTADAQLDNNPVDSCYAQANASVYCADYNWYRSDSETSTSCGAICIACP